MAEDRFHPDQGIHVNQRNGSRLQLLIDTGLLLASERSLEGIVQAALDAGLRLSGAQNGAFVPSAPNGSKGYPSLRVTGVDAERWAEYATPRTPSLSTGNEGTIVRLADLTADPRSGVNWRSHGMAVAQDPVRSYLEVPVRSRGGEALGALLYGHPEPGRFSQEIEPLIATVAAQVAVAIDTARLTTILQEQVAAADKARAEQRKARRRLELALEAARLGIWCWEVRTGTVTFDQRAADLLGVAADTPISRNEVRDRLLRKDEPNRTGGDLGNLLSGDLLSGDGPYVAEYRIHSPGGGERWVAATGAPDLDEHGERLGLTGTLQDITDRKQQEHSLRTSEKLAATGRLAATIAHEINNPLEAVTNLIYLARTDPAVPVAIERLLETADNELARVSHIAQQTLGFYRDTTRPVTIDMNDLLGAVVELFGRKLIGKRLRCTLDLEPGLSVTGLQGEIRQVVSNLLVNAIDASPTTGAHIRIRGRRRFCNGNRGVAVLISDQGTGIPKEVGRRLFTPFVTTKQSLGTGLGLWVTRGMVEKHGGSVHFRSRTELPSGTVFRVFLPESADARLFASHTPAVLQ